MVGRLAKNINTKVRYNDYMSQKRIKSTKIGVFDSGIGGLSVANALKSAMPAAEIVFVNDKKNVPYGKRKVDELETLVVPILQKLADEGCDVIVIACNTVTTTLLPKLRQQFDVPLVGIVPMVKPATKLTRTGVIAVCATPTTLTSPRYQELKQIYASNIKVIEPDCSDWSALIESKKTDRIRLSSTIEQICAQGADVIVLGCTHYHWIEQDILATIGNKKVQVLQPEQAIVAQVKRILADMPGGSKQ